LKNLRKETAFNEVLTAASTCQETLKEGRQVESSWQLAIGS